MFIKLWGWFLATITGITGGLMLTAGYFNDTLSILQSAAFVPLLFLLCNQKKILPAMYAGFCMGITFILPQMLVLHFPILMAVALGTVITIVLVLLCGLAGWCTKKDTLLSCFAFGAGWMLLDWLSYTAIPIWGMAQSMARNWTAYPHLISFIQFTGISGIFFIIGTLQALFVRLCCEKQNRISTLVSLGGVLLLVLAMDLIPLLEKPTGTIRVAAAGWTMGDSRGGFYGPDDKKEEFNALFAEPAARAAAQGAEIFVSGEMAFNIYSNNQIAWNSKFSEVARQNNLYLVVGYYSSEGNRLFFMNPQGEIVADYLKTYLSPPEWGGKHGNGDLKVIDVDGVNVGAMICHDDNFSRLTRHYGRYKTPLVLVPTWDWQEVKDAHLAAVRARAIECRFGIARSTYHGITAIISSTGEILEKHDTFTEGPGVVIADVPLYQGVTVFARFGHIPIVTLAAGIFLAFVQQTRTKRP